MSIEDCILLERRMRWKSHVRCGGGEKLEIISKVYLFLFKANIDTIFTVSLISGYEDKASIVNLIDDADELSPWSFCEKDLLVYDPSDNTFKEMWLIEEALIWGGYMVFDPYSIKKGCHANDL